MGLYIAKPAHPSIVEATQVGPGAQATVQGSRSPKPGEWVVTDHVLGQTWVMDANDFAAAYEPLPIPGHLLSPDANPPLMAPVPGEPVIQPPSELEIVEPIPGEPVIEPPVRPVRVGYSQVTPSPLDQTPVLVAESQGSVELPKQAGEPVILGPVYGETKFG